MRKLEDLNEELNKYNLFAGITNPSILVQRVRELENQISELRKSINNLEISGSYEKLNSIEKQISMSKTNSDDL